VQSLTQKLISHNFIVQETRDPEDIVAELEAHKLPSNSVEDSRDESLSQSISQSKKKNKKKGKK